MFTLSGEKLLWLLSFIFVYLIHTTLARPYFLSYYCENKAIYTLDSEYQSNLDDLSALITTNTLFGFYNLSIGSGNDTVHSVALCRGDINTDVCLRCLIDSIIRLRQLCPNQKEAIGYYDYCMVKYSNQIILGSTRIKFYVYLANPQNATDINQFNGALGPLMRELRASAAAGGSLLKFASGSTNLSEFSTIYGLVQCTPDLSEEQCNDCLEDIINRIALWFNGAVGGRILLPMCTFRYETYRFFNQRADHVISPPPILPPSIPQQPDKKNKNKMMRNVIIIIVVVIVIFTLPCIIMRLRKKKRTMPPTAPKSIQMENMDIGTLESLQYDFSTVKEATNDFSKENKLGRGGFGTVYKEVSQNQFSKLISYNKLMGGRGV